MVCPWVSTFLFVKKDGVQELFPLTLVLSHKSSEDKGHVKSKPSKQPASALANLEEKRTVKPNGLVLRKPGGETVSYSPGPRCCLLVQHVEMNPTLWHHFTPELNILVLLCHSMSRNT